MTLESFEDIEKVWGSHIPLLQAFLGIKQPRAAIECGCGHFSTPRIARCVEQHFAIEHNPEWAKELIEKYPQAEWRGEYLPETGAQPFTEADMQRCCELYDRYQGSLPPVDLLFVDTVPRARTTALYYLRDKADYILLHDTDPESWLHYGYPAFLRSDYHHYQLQPRGKVNGHKIEWTSLFCQEELDLSQWRGVIDPYAKDLWGFSAPFVEVTT